VEVVASLSQGRTAAAQCGLFTHRSVPVIFEPPCKIEANPWNHRQTCLLFYIKNSTSYCKMYYGLQLKWKQNT